MSLFGYVAPSVLVLNVILYTYIFVKFHNDEAGNIVQRDDDYDDRKRVLVTGGVGFIGFHVSLGLLTQRATVVAADNFNDYYDVNLKIERAYILLKRGVYIKHVDICDEQRMRALWAEYNFTHVIHLGAQAGVRYSIEHPLSYAENNVQCYIRLLNIVKQHKAVGFIYASSSSVYGPRAPVPFLERNYSHTPGNMYAASKLTNELLGAHYCSVHGVRALGLRFFTVYGPWGRPDMAVFKFTEAIQRGESVPLFQSSESQPLSRDFTYIDDIVGGVLSALDYTPASCEEVLNLGRGQPVSVRRLLSLLQKHLQKKAVVKDVPLPRTEILVTWADISESQNKLKYNPVTTLETGVERFVEWYKVYRRMKLSSKGETTDAQEWYQKLPKHTYHEPRLQVCSDAESDCNGV